DRFLTEREIADRFGVSRPTANKALASLVSEGLLEFRRGVGTFVQRLRAKLAQLVPEQRIRPLSWVAATKPRLALAWWVALPHIPGGTFPSGGAMSRSLKLRTLLPACLDMMRWLSHTGQVMDARIVRNPIYQQLNDRLRSALAAEYRRGDRFLTEREIAERFG
ncbi:MAG: GntR family transcriptional regulator, partial [Pirellulaceae bacterium]